MPLCLTLAKDHAHGGSERGWRVFVGGKIGAELREGDQIVGIVNCQTNYGLTGLYQRLHQGGLLRVEVGVDRDCQHDIRSLHLTEQVLYAVTLHLEGMDADAGA